jgi:hypothetical protein
MLARKVGENDVTWGQSNSTGWHAIQPKVNKAEEQAIEISYTKNAHWESGLLNQWRYNQVQKLMLPRCLLNFSLELCGLILLSNF